VFHLQLAGGAREPHESFLFDALHRRTMPDAGDLDVAGPARATLGPGFAGAVGPEVFSDALDLESAGAAAAQARVATLALLERAGSPTLEEVIA